MFDDLSFRSQATDLGEITFDRALHVQGEMKSYEWIIVLYSLIIGRRPTTG